MKAQGVQLGGCSALAECQGMQAHHTCIGRLSAGSFYLASRKVVGTCSYDVSEAEDQVLCSNSGAPVMLHIERS